MRYWLVVLTLFLTSCAAVPERPPVEDPHAAWSQRVRTFSSLTRFDVRGRLALRRGDEGVHLSLHWAHRHGIDELFMVGPLGGGRVRINASAEGAELRDTGGRVHRAASLRDLLAESTGWVLPLDAFRFWLFGIPAPGASYEYSMDPWGRARTLEQLGWKIEVLEYMDQDGHALPRRLFVARQSQPGSSEPVEGRVVIDQWVVGESP